MIYPHKITHLPATKSTSATGGLQHTWATTGTTYRAFCQYRSDAPDEINQSAVSNTGLVAYVEPAIDPKIIDRIQFNGELFEIFSVKPFVDARGQRHHVELKLSNLNANS
jgi:hypothetical protein